MLTRSDTEPRRCHPKSSWKVDFSAEVEEAPEHQGSDTQVPEESNVAVDDIEGPKVDIVPEPVRRRYPQRDRKPKQPNCWGYKNN